MTVIGYAQLWAADPADWSTAGSAWRGLVGLADRRVAEVNAAATVLRAGWSGPAGRAADLRLRGLGAELAVSRPAFVEAEQVLSEYATRLGQAKALLDATVGAAASRGVRVDRRGVASADPAAHGSTGGPPTTGGAPTTGGRPSGSDPAAPGPAAEAAAAVAEVAAGIRAALELATAADLDAARRLADLATGAGEGWASPTSAAPPPPGTDPAVVRQWWAQLTPTQRRWLVAEKPALVGRLDGVPARDRDQANRLLLERHHAALLAERAALLAGPFTRLVPVELARIDRSLAPLDVLRDRLAAETPRAYLLRLDPAGDGRAIVAIGNPDRAENVLTYVPGMTADLPSVANELRRAESMATRCAELAPTERTAVVLWLDYDAPDWLHQATRDNQAHDAGPALHGFQEGLRATHEGPPAQQTVLGHSYGSLVVGTTARDHGLAADRVVFVGSPGVGVDRAADLGLAEGQVWASTAGNDVIRHASGPAELLGRLGLGAALPGVGGLLAYGNPADELWFGADPSGADFGARLFAGRPDGHVGYWNPGNPALDAIARITVDGRAR
ncbi:alpha/beta hydrolase [Micromonospora sp. NPDC050397]|uniref:alpha/beta hydrolase n=1 Tax=Micromonospora sp. NPDC050397 TaxID=3364279 RepID=UPI00384DA055